MKFTIEIFDVVCVDLWIITCDSVLAASQEADEAARKHPGATVYLFDKDNICIGDYRHE